MEMNPFGGIKLAHYLSGSDASRKIFARNSSAAASHDLSVAPIPSYGR